MDFRSIDFMRLRRDIASTALQCLEMKRALRRTWTEPMAEAQRRLARLRRHATDLHVLLAWARGRLHVTSPPQGALGSGAAWDRDGWHARVAERVALDYAADTRSAEVASP